MIPWELLRRVAEREIARDGSRPLFVTISGAHLYGFPSADSDFDLRGAHVAPLERVLSMKPWAETLTYAGVEDGREMDVVSHEAGKFFGLLLKKNGYVLEQILSPLVVFADPSFEELRDIARGCLTRHLAHHYRGFAETVLRELDVQADKRAKSALYAYRVLLTGIHALRGGGIEADLNKLLELRPLDGVQELLRRKIEGGETGPIPADEAARHRETLASLRVELDRAAAESPLPDVPEKAGALDAFLVRLRLSAAKGAV